MYTYSAIDIALLDETARKEHAAEVSSSTAGSRKRVKHRGTVTAGPPRDVNLERDRAFLELYRNV